VKVVGSNAEADVYERQGLTRHGVEMLLIARYPTSAHVDASVVHAMCHGFPPVVMKDCVGARAIAPREAGLLDIAEKYGDVVFA
jgi:maleamate amidohydrolase